MTSQLPDPDEPTAKVLFRITDDDGSEEVETLWAYDLGEHRYRLDNCPFYTYGVSLGDIVFAPFDPKERFPTFRKVLRKSGNGTLRIILAEPQAPGNGSEAILEGLKELGCEYELAGARYFAVNVPPATELSAVTDFLQANEVDWEYADPTYEELFPEAM